MSGATYTWSAWNMLEAHRFLRFEGNLTSAEQQDNESPLYCLDFDPR